MTETKFRLNDTNANAGSTNRFVCIPSSAIEPFFFLFFWGGMVVVGLGVMVGVGMGEVEGRYHKQQKDINTPKYKFNLDNGPFMKFMP